MDFDGSRLGTRIMVLRRYLNIQFKRFGMATLFVFITASAILAADLKQAQTLYKQNKYLESIALSPQDSAEGIYLIYLNEKEIGGRANSYSDNPREYGFLYYQYIKKHPTLFETDEAAGDSYEPTRYRYDQLRKLNPKSPYVGNIEYEWAVDFDNSVWEDGDGSMHSKELIADYEDLIKRFPSAEFVPKAKARVIEIKELHKLRTGENL